MCGLGEIVEISRLLAVRAAIEVQFTTLPTRRAYYAPDDNLCDEPSVLGVSFARMQGHSPAYSHPLKAR